MGMFLLMGLKVHHDSILCSSDFERLINDEKFWNFEN
jgi:hypothetical protein